MYAKYGKKHCRSKKSESDADPSKEKDKKSDEDDDDEEEFDPEYRKGSASMHDEDEEDFRKGTGSSRRNEDYRKETAVPRDDEVEGFPPTEERKGSASPRNDDDVDDFRKGTGSSRRTEDFRKNTAVPRDDEIEGLPATESAADDENADESATNEGFNDETGEGADSTGGDDNEDDEFGGSDDSQEDDGGDADESELAGEEAESIEGTARGKKRKKASALEYDIHDMYPEMNILIQKKKREWDFQDPDIIRAIWLESKTLALAEWKERNAKIKMGKPAAEVRETMTVTLRQEFLKNKAELQKALEERDFEMIEATRDPPHFESIQLATNLTTDMRYKYNRNNPPVPSMYIEHFEKFKKPPFKNNPNPLRCRNC